MIKKIFLLFFVLSCGEITEQKIGYTEIVENAWDYFSVGDYESARTEFINALDYEVLTNIAEAYIGIGWSNLYIANEFTDLTNVTERNLLRDQAYDNFQNAKNVNNNSDSKISDGLNSILSAGLIFVYDFKLLDYKDQYYNSDCPECGYNSSCDLNNYRRDCIIPTAIDIVNESNKILFHQSNFEFIHDNSINIDDIYFIRARLAFSFNDFISVSEFPPNQIIEEYKLDNTDGYFRHQEEICKINELTDDCIALGLDQYCLESSPNIPYESFLSCLSSFYTPELNK